MTVLQIEGKKVRVSDDFLKMSPEDQERTVDEIAAKIGAQKPQGFMANVNRGIVDTAGGLVDFINPFDKPLWEGGPSTGSAQTGLENVAGAVGIDLAEGEPQGVVGGIGRGVGSAAASLIPVAKGAQLLKGAGGVIGNVADDAFTALMSKLGIGAELAAGGIAGGAEAAADAMGAPEWVQDSAAVLAPLSIPAAAAAARGAGRVATKLPLAGAALRTGREVVKSVAPMSEAGARGIVRDRLQGLAGGEDRAAELAGRIDPNDPLGLTPAQQTGDPNLIGLERSAAAESPVLREALTAREAASRAKAAEGMAIGGNTEDARKFFTSRIKEFKAGMQARVDTAIQMGDESLAATGPVSSETGNSTRLTAKINAELDKTLAEERALWGAVPKDARIASEGTASAVKALIEETPWAQRRDIPDDLRMAFGPSGLIGDKPTVAQLYGLYSEMRRTARTAMAGSDQNKNRARIANSVADAILSDLGAVDGLTPVGKAINDARAFSRALHETFDQGTVGNILKRTIDGDTTMTPEVALKRTVGRGGADAMTDARNIEAAAPQASAEITDYLRGRFADSVFTASGDYSPKAAATWLRNNREVLNRYPDLQREMNKALGSRAAADTLAARVKTFQDAADRAPAAEFAGKGQDAVKAILGASDPAQAARSIVATARKDRSGKALAGVKASLSDYLIGQSGMDGAKLSALIGDRSVAIALRRVYSPEEYMRIEKIAAAMKNMDVKPNEVGDVMNAPGNKLLEFVVRIAAARHGAQLGGGNMGGSLQAAGMASERAKVILRGLTNARARELLMAAVTDPALYRSLLLEPQSVSIPASVRSKLAPYLVGGAAQVGEE